MTALAQGSAGLALVMGFALLVSGQVTAAAILLAVQSAAVAVTAVVLHQPMMAIPPLILAAGIWLIQRETTDPRTSPAGGAKFSIGIAAVLAILCQSLGILALPSAVILLSILLAATRSDRLMQMVALVAAQNGVALAGCVVAPPPVLPSALLFPITCLALPIPLGLGLLSQTRSAHGRLHVAQTWMAIRPGFVRALGWIDLGLALSVFIAAMTVPLDSLAAIFAPLLALDGVIQSSVRRQRQGQTALRRVAALAKTVLIVLAVSSPDPMLAWLSVFAAIAMVVLPTLPRRWNSALLAFLAAGLALFGLLILPATISLLGWFSLFAGFAAIAATIPEMAVPLVILILRRANGASWPPGAEALGIAIAVIALLACAVLLTNPAKPHRVTLLTLAQASVATVSICLGQPDGRFGALVLLILLILLRSAARIAGGPAGTLAVAGLGGASPLGVFPGLVLVALAVGAGHAWLFVPLGVAFIPILVASIPRHFPDFSPRKAVPSIAWLPLALATLAGYFTPNGLVHWWRLLTAGLT